MQLAHPRNCSYRRAIRWEKLFTGGFPRGEGSDIFLYANYQPVVSSRMPTLDCYCCHLRQQFRFNVREVEMGTRRPLIVQMVHDPTALEPRCRLQVLLHSAMPPVHPDQVVHTSGNTTAANCCGRCLKLCTYSRWPTVQMVPAG